MVFSEINSSDILIAPKKANAVYRKIGTSLEVKLSNQ